jgi:hypothetical protein
MEALKTLVPLLVDAIPLAIASLNLTKPICILRIVYYDTHAPFTYLNLRWFTSETRSQSVADNDPYCFWGDGGDGEISLPPEKPASKTDKQIASLFKAVYELLCEDDHEEENMVRFRQVIRDVSKQLNTLDWSKICAVTDDFVVLPADGSMCFGGEEIEDIQTIPTDRLDLLKSRGLVPMEWFDPVAAKAAYEQEMFDSEARGRQEKIDQRSRDAEHKNKGNMPCPQCGKPLRSNQARQCFSCGADWH